VTGGLDDPRMYVRLAARRRHAIENGELPPGKRTPSIASLCQEHGVSQATAGHALQVLEAEELVWLCPGHGYYVV
jgi:DNA-binding GntR family transcriptional regulator